MKNLKVFNNNEFGEVRVFMKGTEPWFVGKDIAEKLGYERADNAIRRHVDSDDKLTHKISASAQNRNMTIINESGLYSLIMRSKLPTAKKFKKWVTNEVLPSIRKNGVYMTDDTLERALHDPEFLIKLATNLKEEKNKNKELETENKVQKQIIGELKPKADYMDGILKSKSLVSITQIAKDYGMSGKAMNSVLHKLKVQYKLNGQWLLYSKHQGKSYTHSDTMKLDRSSGNIDIVMTTKWTQKGRLFLYEILKKNDILPMIEKEDL